MPWILNKVNKPVKVALGSDEMNAARDVYISEQDAKAAQREFCKHETLIGIRSTGYVACADCGQPHS